MAGAWRRSKKKAGWYSRDIFEAFFGGGFGGAFGGGGRPAGPAQGGDVAVNAEIDLAAAAHGTKVDVAYEAVVPLRALPRQRRRAGNADRDVSAVWRERSAARRLQDPVRPGRTGHRLRCLWRRRSRREQALRRLRTGRGRRVEHVKLSVDVPAGIAAGQRIRVAGRGHAGEHGGPAGDLYVLIRVREDSRFMRDGDDLSPSSMSRPRWRRSAPPFVPTIEGPVDLEIPAGTQPNETIVMKARGMRAARPAPRRPEGRRQRRGPAAPQA